MAHGSWIMAHASTPRPDETMANLLLDLGVPRFLDAWAAGCRGFHILHHGHESGAMNHAKARQAGKPTDAVRGRTLLHINISRIKSTTKTPQRTNPRPLSRSLVPTTLCHLNILNDAMLWICIFSTIPTTTTYSILIDWYECFKPQRFHRALQQSLNNYC